MIILKNEHLSITFFGVSCGDAILIHFLGDDNSYHNILIDGGFVKTYKPVLKPALTSIKADDEKIDVVVATHYDGDHIGGLLSFVNDNSFNLEKFVDRWIINFDLPLLDPGRAVSVQQLMTLKKKLYGLTRHNEQPIIANPIPYKIHGLWLSILSPDAERYEAAKNKIEARTTLIASIGNDYGIKIDEFVAIVKTEPIEDASSANGSSIAFLIQGNGYSSLLLADAFPSVICRSIRALKHNENNPLVVDSIKLSHHGSRANISNELLSITKSNHYIICGNGMNTHNLPNKETIARILIKGNRNKEDCFHFYFTHWNKLLEDMFSIDGEDIFQRYNFKIHFPGTTYWT